VTAGERPKRAPRFGPEPWKEIAGLTWSLWDLWFCVVAMLDHDGDLEALTDTFVDALRDHRKLDRNANEAKLGHLTDLVLRLDDVELHPADLANADVLADQRLVNRAREKVTGRVSLEWRACTPAMIDTPRRLLQHRARFGHWQSFPSDPTPFFERFRRTVERKGFVTKKQTFDITRTLRNRLCDLDGPRRKLPDRLALYRAFHTAGLEIADAADDSYGVLGESRTEAWLTYLDVDWRSAGMAPADYWQDLCELIIWEPYAIDHQNETAWFSSARPDDFDLIEGILLALESEHRAVVLDWEATAALEALAGLYVATGARDRFVGIAGRLPPHSWQHVESMARSQMAAGDRDGAVAVFHAAISAHVDGDHLRKRCVALTGVDLGTDAEGSA
jgi:hypothetical protein